MAQTKSKVSSTPTHTAAEIKKWYEKNEKNISNFAKAQNALKQLVDPTKSTTRTYSTFDKTKLRTYMKNPPAQYKNLRNLSRYLYYRSSVYRRLVWFNATMIDTNARAVIPIIDINKGGDKAKVLKSYYDTLSVLNNMNLALEFLKAYIIAWREDVFFGMAFYDDTGYFILPVDPDYAKVNGAYMTGDLSYVMDMSYYSRHEDMVEWIGEPLTSMYRQYQNNSTENRWQQMPDEYCVCFKVNIDDYEIPLPPYMNLFNSLINLADLEDIQAVADEANIYKLVTATIPLSNDQEGVDQFLVDPDTAIEYYNKFVDSLPDYIAAAITPIPLDVLTFGDDQATDVNKIENATKTVFNTSGGAQLLNSSSISGTTAWQGAIKFDEKYAISSLLPQTQAYLNRFLSYQVSNPAKVKMLETSPYTKSTLKKEMLDDATYGLPTALVVNNLNGFNELETLSMNFLLHDTLDITSSFVPLQSSHTQSSSDNQGGGQTKDIGGADSITDDGEASQDKRDQSNG